MKKRARKGRVLHKENSKKKGSVQYVTLSGLNTADSVVMDCKERDREASPLEAPLALTLEVAMICLSLPLSMNRLFWKAVNSPSVPAVKQWWTVGNIQY